MNIHKITQSEIGKLLECISALSEYHNDISINFKGFYPSKPYKTTLALFTENLKSGMSQIAAVEDREKIIGFCKIDILNNIGKLDYLIVLQEYRGNGYGKMLMDWAMEQFNKSNVEHIEVKVIDGNEAIHLYEKYGFKMKSHILWNKCD